MTRISSLFVATTLAILPISAFAQSSPMKDTAPAGVTGTAPATASIPGKTASAPTTSAPATGTPTSGTSTLAGSTATTPMHNAPAANAAAANTTMGNATTAKVTHPAKSAVKTSVPGPKSEVHGMNTVTTHHAKVSAPAKVAEPTKS